MSSGWHDKNLCVHISIYITYHPCSGYRVIFLNRYAYTLKSWVVKIWRQGHRALTLWEYQFTVGWSRQKHIEELFNQYKFNYFFHKYFHKEYYYYNMFVTSYLLVPLVTRFEPEVWRLIKLYYLFHIEIVNIIYLYSMVNIKWIQKLFPNFGFMYSLIDFLCISYNTSSSYSDFLCRSHPPKVTFHRFSCMLSYTLGMCF